MTTTPGYLSNAELAQRISALVDRWNTRENQMIALLTQPEGEVTVTDGLGANHVLPSFPQLQKDVSQMTDELTGAVAEVRDLNSVATAMAVAAEESAVSAGTSATDANTAATSAAADSTSAAASAVSASQAEQTAGTHAQNSVTYADAAHVSAGYAAQSASESSTQANLAIQARAASESARDLAQAYATAPEGTEVVPGEYSAYHWAKRAESTATGNVIYMGLWNPASGAYPESPIRGHMYRVSDTGSFNGVDYVAGDQILYNGTTWDRVSNSSDVQSVAGKTGAVLLVAEDVGGLGALATRNDADWSTQVTGKPVSFPPTAHSHSFGAITGKPETATRWPVVAEVGGLGDALAAKASSAHLTSTSGYFSVESYGSYYGEGRLRTFYDAGNTRWIIDAVDAAGATVVPSLVVGGNPLLHSGNLGITRASVNGYSGIASSATPGASVLLSDSGTQALTSASTLVRLQGGNTQLDVTSSGVSVSGTLSDSLGNVRGLPPITRNFNATFILTDAGRMIITDDATNRTWTVPAEATTNFPIGSMITVVNGHGAKALTIVRTPGVVIRRAGTNGDHVVAAATMSTLVKILPNVWLMS